MTTTFRRAFTILLLAAGPAAADTANVDVTANIKGVCRIESIQSIDFGDLEQGTTAADKTVPGTINYWCTKGVPYAVTLGPGANPAGAMRRMKGQGTANASEYLSYTLVLTSPEGGIGRGPQSPVALGLQGTVSGAEYNTLSVGALKDTVVVTISP